MELPLREEYYALRTYNKTTAETEGVPPVIMQPSEEWDAILNGNYDYKGNSFKMKNAARRKIIAMETPDRQSTQNMMGGSAESPDQMFESGNDFN